MSVLMQTVLLSIAAIVGDRQKVYNELSQRTKWNNNYDFIIVGGGSAGSVVAARLAQNHNISVLLLEEGDRPPIEFDLPGLSLCDSLL